MPSRVAESLGIPHYVLDYEERFEKAVMQDFADYYVRGETPIPCVRCNERVKFADLLDIAQRTGRRCARHRPLCAPRRRRERCRIASRGRYQRATRAISCSPRRQEQLSYLRFPLGGMEKREVRAIAAELGLAVADKPDSQDICFVPQGRYVSVVKKLRPDASAPGDIVDLEGRVLGSPRWRDPFHRRPAKGPGPFRQ